MRSTGACNASPTRFSCSHRATSSCRPRSAPAHSSAAASTTRPEGDVGTALDAANTRPMGAFASFAVLLDTASSLEQFVRVFVGIYILLILICVLLSWVRIPYSKTFATVERFLDEVVTPYLGIFRGRIPTIGPIDISPIIAVVVLLIAQELVIYVIGAVL